MNAAARAKDVFLDALELEAGERTRFVEQATASDAELRARVVELLRAHGGAEDVLGRGPSSWDGRAPASGVGDLRHGDRVGPYLVRGEIGEGGFGLVYAADQTEPVQRRVAIKLLKRGLDTRAVLARFEAERQALERMDHPGIARVLDAGSTDSGRPYFVMELVDGLPITTYCTKHELELPERLALFRSVCHALQHAHQKGVVHRDVKPSNVLVVEVDGEPHVKVIDFGVAKATAPDVTRDTVLTREGHLIGTPAYMSPEQTLGADSIDARSDVYSLGVLLYELLTGCPPFDLASKPFSELLRIVREEDPPRPSARLRERTRGPGRAGHATTAAVAVPRDLDWIALRCLEKEPERRYPSAEALARDVSRFLAEEPVDAAPPSAWYRVRKLARRHRVLAAALASVLLTLVLGVAGTGVGLVRARRANAALDVALARAQDETRRAREAETRAAAEGEEARHQERVARAVNDFLNQDLLAAAIPGGEANRRHDVTMREVLDRASVAIGEDGGARFADAPLVEASVRNTIGWAYFSIGLFREALPHLERAALLRRRELGDADPDALATLGVLADAYRHVGRLDESEALLGEVVEARHGHAGPESPDLLQALRSLASLRGAEGRYDDAVRLLEDVLAVSTEVLGERHPDTVKALTNLAVAVDRAGDLEEGGRLHERSLALHREVFGSSSSETLTALNNLAANLLRRGLPGAAIPLLEEARRVQVELLGPDHVESLAVEHNLALAYLDQGRLDEAEELSIATHEGYARAAGPDSPEALRSLATLADVALHRGEEEEAEETMRDVLATAERTLGRDHPQTLGWLQDLARVAHARGRLDEASALMADVLERRRRVLGPDHPEAVTSLVNQAYFQRAAGDLEAARATYAEALERGARAYGAGSAFQLRTRADLAELLLDLGEPAAAEREASRAASGLRALGQARPQDRAAALAAGGAALDALGRPAEAEPLLREAWPLVPDATSPLARRIAGRLAASLRAQERDAEAAEWAARAAE